MEIRLIIAMMLTTMLYAMYAVSIGEMAHANEQKKCVNIASQIENKLGSIQVLVSASSLVNDKDVQQKIDNQAISIMNEISFLTELQWKCEKEINDMKGNRSL